MDSINNNYLMWLWTITSFIVDDAGHQTVGAKPCTAQGGQLPWGSWGTGSHYYSESHKYWMATPYNQPICKFPIFFPSKIKSRNDYIV